MAVSLHTCKIDSMECEATVGGMALTSAPRSESNRYHTLEVVIHRGINNVGREPSYLGPYSDYHMPRAPSFLLS